MMGQAPGRDFWSRRRAGVEAEAEAGVAARKAAEAAEAQAALERVQAEKTDDEILAELGLKDPDTMEQGDDFAAFLQGAVPERLRRRALRRLWRSNPVLANLDGLVDHGEDYTDAATVIPDMQTAYQVGRGMLRHVAALAEQIEAEQLEADASAPDAEVAEDEIVAGTQVEYLTEAAPRTETDPVEVGENEQSEPRARRHMRFAFAD